MKKRIYLALSLILVLLIISGVSSCDVSSIPGLSSGDQTTLSKDVMEFSKTIGSLTAKIIVKPGKDRIAVGAPVNLAVDIANTGDNDISGDYVLSDTPGPNFGGLDTLTGSFTAIAQDTTDTLKETTVIQYNTIDQTQLLLTLTWKDKTTLHVKDICLKENVNENVGISCDAESKESITSSKSPITSSTVEKRLLDNDFDGRTDELTLSFKLNVNSNCKLEEIEPITVETLNAAGISGFKCNYEGNTLFCKTSPGITDYYTGPLDAVLSYKCEAKINSGAIKLNPKEE